MLEATDAGRCRELVQETSMLAVDPLEQQELLLL
jgi:hypothetical protein